MMSVQENDTSALAGFLRSEMERRGWSLTMTAQRSGLNKSTLATIIAENGSVPRLDTLLGIAQALDVPLSRLIRLSGYELGPEHEPIPTIQRALLIESSAPLREAFDALTHLPPEDHRAVLQYIRWYAANSPKQEER